MRPRRAKCERCTQVRFADARDLKGITTDPADLGRFVDPESWLAVDTAGRRFIDVSEAEARRKCEEYNK
jgi:hypothetical protein